MSVISSPDLPQFFVSQGDAMMLPLASNCVRSSVIGMGFPWSSLRRALGSNESTCDTPPDM